MMTEQITSKTSGLDAFSSLKTCRFQDAIRRGAAAAALLTLPTDTWGTTPGVLLAGESGGEGNTPFDSDSLTPNKGMCWLGEAMSTRNGEDFEPSRHFPPGDSFPLALGLEWGNLCLGVDLGLYLGVAGNTRDSRD